METTRGVTLKVLRWKKPSILDEPIDNILEEMRMHDPETKEYETALRHLERLIKLDRDKKSTKVSPDTIALVIGNLLGILVIVAYEQKHIMGSKGLGFILKPKPGN
jgi:hypothetical protein